MIVRRVQHDAVCCGAALLRRRHCAGWQASGGVQRLSAGAGRARAAMSRAAMSRAHCSSSSASFLRTDGQQQADIRSSLP